MHDADGPRASLDLTHVLYDDSSYLSLALALATLSPILLMACYASLAVQTREIVIINMWAGQLLCEAFNWVIKRTIKQDRPIDSVGNGYGFPSSHSQFMGYFATFLALHLVFRHRFAPTGSTLLDRAGRALLCLALAAWAGVVAYSRLRLGYHTPHQIAWGLGLGAACGGAAYGASEVLPRRRPRSAVARARRWLVANPVSAWLGVRDGWAVWADGGREDAWLRWKAAWDAAEKRAA